MHVHRRQPTAVPAIRIDAHEMASIEDVENLIKLIYETLKTIDPNKSFKYFS